MMHSLEHNTIDFLSRYCKHAEHKNCHGNWSGLGFRVDCNCLCHNDNRNRFSNVHSHDSINTLNQKGTLQETLFSNSNDSNQNKIDDINERDEAAKLHLSLRSSSQKRLQ